MNQSEKLIEPIKSHQALFEMSYVKMTDAISQVEVSASEEHVRQAHFYIHATLHFLLDCLERIKLFDSYKNKPDLKHWDSAFRFANDKLKHTPSLIYSATVDAGKTYPYRYSYRYGIRFIWPDLSGHIRDGNITDINRNEAYKMHLSGKQVEQTFQEAREIVIAYIEVL